MRRLMRSFIADENGATAVEYGLVMALIAVALLSVLATIGVNLVAKFQAVADAIVAAA